jgi:L-fuconolactonase
VIAVRIDSHQHFWRLRDRVGQWPPADLTAIYRDFLPADLEPMLRMCGIDGTVLVQSRPAMADTAFMLELADRHSFIRGVVGWVELKAPDAPAHIAQLVSYPKLKGLRPMLRDIADIDWIDDPALDAAAAAMIAHRLRFDALVMPPHLKALRAFARRHPELPVVIDHGAKPRIAMGHFSEWRAALAKLAALPNVHCKLSGLLTEAGGRREAAALRPYVETLLEIFGPGRILWGSDWPVLGLAGEYADWLAMCLEFIPVEHRAAVFGGNASSFYQLDQGQHQSSNRAGSC